MKEIWRYEKKHLKILQLKENEYVESEFSQLFPKFDSFGSESILLPAVRVKPAQMAQRNSGMGASQSQKIMSSPTERFSNRVENYVKYRPSYPKEVLQLFRDEMNLQTSSIIADIGSGTGISAKLFLENGNVVYGVEPNKLMREAVESFFARFFKISNIQRNFGKYDI